MKLKIRDVEVVEEQPVEVYLEQEDDEVVVCVKDSQNLEWGLVRIKPNGTVELCSCMDSEDFCSSDGYVMITKE